MYFAFGRLAFCFIDFSTDARHATLAMLDGAVMEEYEAGGACNAFALTTLARGDTACLPDCTPATMGTLPYPSMNPSWQMSNSGGDELASYAVLTALTVAGGVIVLATVHAQASSPAPYGRHEAGHPEAEAGKWGPPVAQRTAHVLSDFPPGVLAFLAVFLGWGYSEPYGQLRAPSAAVRYNWLFLALWLAHYVHRGLLHPLLIMRYSSRTVRLGIPLAGVFPNLLFCYINSCWIATCVYPPSWGRHPAFIIGIVLFSIGFVLNKAADWQTARLRKRGETEYKPPAGLSLLLNVANANYTGELIEWTGFAIAAWSPPAIVWAAFGAATFVPRSKHNLLWLRKQFGGQQAEGLAGSAAPKHRLPRWALIPGVW